MALEEKLIVRWNMKCSKILFSALLLLSLPGIAAAETDWCYDYVEREEYSRAVEVCSGDINGGSFSGERLAHKYYTRGRAYYSKSEFNMAIADLTSSLNIVLNPLTYRQRASSYLGTKEYYNAIADCTRAIELDPDFADAYYVRSIAYKATGEKNKADADLRRAMDLDPTYIDMLEYE